MWPIHSDAALGALPQMVPGHMTGFPVLLILVRISLLVVRDSYCCEVGYSALNRILTAARSRLEVTTVKDILTTHFVGDEIKIFKAQPIFDT